ncbi:Lipid II flippase FtsW [Lyticum sinuosum]|uniref:Probable peptidoglycan glycosyltransferase FtsW n=2 Tax=Lyticum sinuosum TaxID=1332059 RepID=A0AAE4VKZ7_9RICK|nr:Lipid II flippase FtsW [Lyticum sinuosum]
MKKTTSKQISLLLSNIDHILFLLVCIMIIFGLIMLATAGPASSERINISSMHFFANQIVYAFCSIFIMLFIAFLKEEYLIKVVYIGFIFSVLGLILLPFFGDVNKGAKRWLNIIGVSVQPSEILKPFYSFIIAKILSNKQYLEKQNNNQNSFFSPLKNIFITENGRFFCVFLIHLPIATLIIIQPDFGMTITITLSILTQLFISNLPWIWIIISCSLILILFVFCYITMPHVNQRIDLFFNNGNALTYQIEKSLASYSRGGAFGVGPGEGIVKYHLPDSHTDFIFAVAGEEFGSIPCLVIITLFAAIVLRSLYLSLQTKDDFSLISIVGIVTYIAFQSIFNIGVTLNILPTKGMTLPFISYGGSALIASSCGIGIILNLVAKTKHNNRINIIHIKY